MCGTGCSNQEDAEVFKIMKIEDVNDCMTILQIFGADAKEFAYRVFKDNPVTESGTWGGVKWWREVVTKYLKSGTLACGGGALASAAEFAGAAKDIPSEIYLRLWTFNAQSPHAPEAFESLGTFGGKYVPALKTYVNAGPSLITEHCDEGVMTVKNAFGLIECLPPDDPSQNILVEYVARADERLLSLAHYLRYNGGVCYELSNIR